MVPPDQVKVDDPATWKVPSPPRVPPVIAFPAPPAATVWPVATSTLPETIWTLPARVAPVPRRWVSPLKRILLPPADPYSPVEVWPLVPPVRSRLPPAPESKWIAPSLSIGASIVVVLAPIAVVRWIVPPARTLIWLTALKLFTWVVVVVLRRNVPPFWISSTRAVDSVTFELPV